MFLNWSLGKSLLILIFVTILLQPAHAIRFEDAVFPELITNGRALAIGNAYICRVDGSGSPFYNPAGLGTVRYPHLHFTNLHIESNRGLMRSAAGGGAEDILGDSLNALSIDGSRQLLLKNRGQILHNRINFAPNITTRYLSIGYMYSFRNRMTLDLEEDALYEFATREDYGPYAALNISLFGGIIKVGATAIQLTRTELIDEVNAEEEVVIAAADYQKGKALIFVGGARLTLPVAFLPTFAATFHNYTGEEFSALNDEAPPKIKSTVDVGFSLTPQIASKTRIHLEANYKDIAQEHSDVSFVRRLVFGMEIDIARFMFFRFGYGDGFGSGGIGIRSRKLEFDLTTYAVDSTTSSFRGKEDRRFTLTLSSGF